MKTIIIDFLDKPVDNEKTYQQAIPSLTQYRYFRCLSPKSILSRLKKINTHNEPLILTFFGHGNILRLGRQGPRVHWEMNFKDLLPALNDCRTNHPLYVNMVANCDSNGIGNFIQFAPAVDEFWVVTDKTESIGKALLAARDNGNSDIFLELNKAENDCQYAKFINGKLVKEGCIETTYL